VSRSLLCAVIVCAATAVVAADIEVRAVREHKNVVPAPDAQRVAFKLLALLESCTFEDQSRQERNEAAALGRRRRRKR
jgi:hypothetical protein